MAGKSSESKSSDILKLSSFSISKKKVTKTIKTIKIRKLKPSEYGAASIKVARSVLQQVTGQRSSLFNHNQYSLSSFGLTRDEILSTLIIHQLTSITLNDCSLDDIPSRLALCTALELLDLSNNQIVRIETTIVIKFRRLVGLNLSRNKLKFLPLQIGMLKNLVSLNLSHNNLKYLPFTLANCVKLKELYLSNNCIKSFNHRFLKIFSDKVSLTRLDVSDNPLVIKDEIPLQQSLKFPDLFSLAAREVIRRAPLITSLPLHMPKDMEDVIQIRSDWCCSCSRPFLRYNQPVFCERFLLSTLAAEVVSNMMLSSMPIKTFTVKCYRCCVNSPNFLLSNLHNLSK
ncbi:uncharacterized protein LOC141855891 [Brevipalpus obovatus]|uniref:uncharacterized protein LOC141855891 n=1 Tax=Brevipalpus obovatus TaxID=246614 RepID=UPI003D9DB939